MRFIVATFWSQQNQVNFYSIEKKGFFFFFWPCYTGNIYIFIFILPLLARTLKSCQSLKSALEFTDKSEPTVAPFEQLLESVLETQ